MLHSPRNKGTASLMFFVLFLFLFCFVLFCFVLFCFVLFCFVFVLFFEMFSKASDKSHNCRLAKPCTWDDIDVEHNFLSTGVILSVFQNFTSVSFLFFFFFITMNINMQMQVLIDSNYQYMLHRCERYQRHNRKSTLPVSNPTLDQREMQCIC